MTSLHLPAALQHAIVTAPDRMPAWLRRKLALFMERVFSAKERLGELMGKLLVVGSVALDTVKTPFGEVERGPRRVCYLLFGCGQLFHER